MSTTNLMPQTEARTLARQLSEQTGLVHVAHTVPKGCWGGTEKGWAVTGPAAEAETAAVQGVIAEARRLTNVWHFAALAVEQALPHSTDRQDQAEAKAYDELVDYVEANELNFTEFDPRGTREEFEATR